MGKDIVTCYGSGLIGSSWATHFILKGLVTIIYDIDDEKLKDAKKRIKHNLDFLLKQDVIDEEGYKACLDRLTLTTDQKIAVKDSFFIQENGPENYELKRKIVNNIEKYAPTDTIIASSTSGLLISEIAKEAKYPERIIGAHPYNPPHLIPLVELSGGKKTKEEILYKTKNFYKSIDKEPVILKKEALGFISNRLQMALYREVLDLVERGVCTYEDVDIACCYGPGLRYALMGPNLIYQLGGGDKGVKGLFSHVGPSIESWWEDMAKWTKWPENHLEKIQNGVDEEMKNRKPGQGQTDEELAKFRDEGLVMLLKYHGKI